MKKVLIICLLAICNLICFGQTTPNQQLRAVFSKVHRTINGVQALPSPFFLNMAVQSFSKDRFYKKINYPDTIKNLMFLTMYSELRDALWDTTRLLNQKTFKNNIKQSAKRIDTLQFGMMDFDYESVVNDSLAFTMIDKVKYYDAFDSSALYYWDNDYLYDRADRTISPYGPGPDSLGPYTHELFVVSPATTLIKHPEIYWQLSGATCLYPLFGKNFTLDFSTSHKLYVDFGDGQGWQYIYKDTFYHAGYYIPKGKVIMQAKVLDGDGNIIKYSKTIVDADPHVENYTYKTDKLYITVKKSCGHQKLTKPIIYLEGFDFDETRTGEDIYQNMIAGNQTKIADLRNFGYDFVIVSWKNSRRSIETNGDAVIKLIESLQDSIKHDNDTFNQFVIIGESMGGLVARYVLDKMESPIYKAYNPKCHNTRLFLSLDAPQRGANVPVGYQHTFETLVDGVNWALGYADMTWVLTAIEAVTGYKLDQLEEESIKQMLIYRYKDVVPGVPIGGNVPNNYISNPQKTALYNFFDLAKPLNQGYPEHVKTFGIANSLLTGESQWDRQYNKLILPDEMIQDFGVTTELSLFWRLITWKAVDLKYEIRTLPIGSGQVADFYLRCEQPKIHGFLRALFGGSGSNNLFAFNIPLAYVSDVKPYDNSVGSNLSQIASASQNLNLGESDWDPLFFLPVSARISEYAHNNVSTTAFIPRNSALNWTSTNGTINEDITKLPITTIEANSPFNVITGYVDSMQYGFSYNYFPINLANNQEHLTFNNAGNYDYLHKEIGTRAMYLDNLSLDRHANFQANDSIVAGNQTNGNYTYANKSAISTLFKNPTLFYSDTNYFKVQNTGGYVKFYSQNVTLDYGFEVEDGAYFETALDTLPNCNFTNDYYRFASSPPPFYNVPSEIKTVKAYSFKIYPNPFENQITLESTKADLFFKDDYNITITNLMGKIVYQTKKTLLFNQPNYLDLDLQNGIYVLNINNSMYNQTTKIICTKK